MSKEPTEKAHFLLDAVESKIFEEGYEALRRFLCAMIRHRELQSLTEEIIQSEKLTKGWTSSLYCICYEVQVYRNKQGSSYYHIFFIESPP